MVQDDPAKRPTMDEVVRRFEHIRKSLSGYKLRSRLVDRSESVVGTLFHGVGHLGQRVKFILQGLPAIPSA